MTAIVGFTDGKTTWIGGDSAGTNSAFSQTIRNDPKIFKNGDFIFGCTSSFRMIQILRFSFKPPKFRSEEKDILEYLCTDFINEIRKVFKDKGYLQTYKEGDDKGGSFLLGYEGRLFRIQSDFQVEESVDPYNACGCGADLCLGVMYVEKHTDKPKKLIIDALQAASYHSAGVAPPFIILSTEKKK